MAKKAERQRLEEEKRADQARTRLEKQALIAAEEEEEKKGSQPPEKIQSKDPAKALAKILAKIKAKEAESPQDFVDEG